MRILILVISLLLVSCKFTNPFGPEFKVGECIALIADVEYFSNREKWEKPDKVPTVNLVMDIGKSNYLILGDHVDYDDFFYRSLNFYSEDVYVKVKCTEQLERFKKENLK